MHPPGLLGGSEIAHRLLDDREQLRDLGRRPGEVVVRQQPERDDLDARLAAPVEQVGDVVGAGLVPARDVVGAAACGPATVAVEDDPDVARPWCIGEVRDQPALVDAVDQVANVHDAKVTPPNDLRNRPRGWR